MSDHVYIPWCDCEDCLNPPCRRVKLTSAPVTYLVLPSEEDRLVDQRIKRRRLRKAVLAGMAEAQRRRRKRELERKRLERSRAA